MKLQFSLATMLVWITVLSIVLAASIAVPVWYRYPIAEVTDGTVTTEVIYGKAYPRLPFPADVLWRLAIWGVPAIVITQIILWLVRRLKSSRHTEPPVG